MRDFSEIAKELRLSKNLTQSQLANRMWVKLYGTDTYTCCGLNFLSLYFLSFEKPPVF